MAEYGFVVVMPAADRSLEDIFLKERPNENKSKCLLYDVAMGLQYLHERGVVHGDLKKLNVLRVQNQLKLIDFDAAVPVGGGILGSKVSSGILPPEMFYGLESADDIARYDMYRGIDQSKRQRKYMNKQCERRIVVKSFLTEKTTYGLRYGLEAATTAVDMWSFGCMMYQMLCGEELVPMDINQNVVSNQMTAAATWTDEKLQRRIETNIPNEWAQDLIINILVVDATQRLSTCVVGQLDAVVKNQATLEMHVHNLLKNARDTEFQAVERTTTAINCLKHDIMSGIIEMNEAVVPTSFVVLPYKIHDAMEPSKLVSFATHLARTCKAIKEHQEDFMESIMSVWNANETLYLYLIDEIQGTLVVSVDDPVYPIEIRTQENNSFLSLNLSWILRGLKHVKGAATFTKSIPTIYAENADEDGNNYESEWVADLETALQRLKNVPATFDRMSSALNAPEPASKIQGADLRTLRQWFDAHDPTARGDRSRTHCVDFSRSRHGKSQ
ncbi:Aste57867_12432 [Aphanomyces stellatus]|uniref:Aste57867_12432 protein n=1 Tax=Aphanomyces stellatus TaxID=120398 RepID=A0A485KW58_9STRA|nr:hypothetical protein As57867_012386 [Aphanomyces stellatus]VFT89283.1 Aste57867_12432 [Aphanomyces stellatus]